MKLKCPRGFWKIIKHHLNISLPSPTPMNSNECEEEPSCKLELFLFPADMRVNVSTAVCSHVINVGDLGLLHI